MQLFSEEQKRHFTLRGVRIHGYNCDLITEMTFLLPEYKKKNYNLRTRLRIFFHYEMLKNCATNKIESPLCV